MTLVKLGPVKVLGYTVSVADKLIDCGDAVRLCTGVHGGPVGKEWVSVMTLDDLPEGGGGQGAGRKTWGKLDVLLAEGWVIARK